MTKQFIVICSLLGLFLINSCKKDNKNTTTTKPNLVFKFKLDPTQQRLNAFGQPDTMKAGHAGQDPVFNAMSAHYIELAQGALTPLGGGVVLYHAEETTAGGSTAIIHDKCTKAKDGEVFFSIPLSQVTAGSYEWLRVSLAYQNYDVKFLIDTTYNFGGTNYPLYQEFPCTVASFVGFNTYISSYLLKNKTVSVNGNRLQGYWGAESTGTIYGFSFDEVNTGQAPAGATTVVNPLFSTSPIPAGSCVVTGQIKPGKLTITGQETQDVVVEVALSTNKSFEWTEVVHDGKWEPAKGEAVVDMGIRGMIPTIK